jgi:type II secretory pathway component GspD/PulD (secretin)
MINKTFFSLSCVAALAGCAASAPMNQRGEALQRQVEARTTQIEKLAMEPAAPQRVVQNQTAFIPVAPVKSAQKQWLKEIKVQLQVGRGAVPMSEVLRALARSGLNIVSEVPLDAYQYSGTSFNGVDAENALRAIVTSVGLDYRVDAQRQLVVIRPMGSRTWYLNIGNRRSSFAAGGSDFANPSATNAVSDAVSSKSGSQASRPSASSSGAAGRTELTSTDDFWASLQAEMEARLKVLLPEVENNTASSSTAATLPPLALAPVSGPQGSSLEPNASQLAAAASAQVPAAAAKVNQAERMVGSFALNPETGAVTVQAPHWILEDLDAYLKRVQDMYNTDLTFQGELLMLTTDAQQTEGLDISSFARFANARYGVVYRNNALGGVTLSFGSGSIPSISAGAGALAGPLLGLVSPLDGLQIFSAYLSNLGQVTSLQKPLLTTTSGVPADFRRTVTRYFNTVSQQAASGGTGSAAVGTQNELIAQDFGTVLRINPRIDLSTGLIRAQIEIIQTTQMGLQTVAQSLTSGDTVQQVNTQLPIVSRMVYSGEALLRDGDLVIMGGQTENSDSFSREGITGLMDQPGPVGAVFGKSTRQNTKNTFYFALRVNVNKR